MARKKAIKDADVGQAALPIALVFGYDRRGSAGMLRGIGRYARECNNWALVSIAPNRRLAESLGTLKPAGIIVGNGCQGIMGILRKTRRPVVSTNSALLGRGFPQVTFDDMSVGSVAANCLLECGLRNFGYFGPPWGGADSGHEGGFRQTLYRLAYKVEICYVNQSLAESRARGGAVASHKRVRQWLAQLPKPAGVFAPNDTWALWLCGVCKHEGIKVPEEVAIIGSDNDELLCELSQPMLSSVAIPSERVGYEAASLLNRMINREPVPDEPILLPATRVVVRQSTNILAVADPDLVPAIDYMRQHICEPIKIEDILRQVSLPRWSFERKFREAMGRSPAQEIRRLRIEMAKTLLTNNPGMKTASIARGCGFTRRTQFFKAFQQATGMTPAEYRRTIG